MIPQVGEIWQHYKGIVESGYRYEIRGFARHAEGDLLVLYSDRSESGEISDDVWARSIGSWTEWVEASISLVEYSGPRFMRLDSVPEVRA